MRRSILALALLTAPAAAQTPWPEPLWNPAPLADDLVLPLPCTGRIALRPVPTPMDAGPLADRAVTLGEADPAIDYSEFPRRAHVAGAFERDGRACQAMCPGAEVELHYHRVSGEDSADMVSAATGLPYREMDNAFLYRKPGVSIPAGCGCGAAAQEARGFQTIGGDYAANEVPGLFGEPGPQDVEATAAIPLPSEKPDPAEDPETLSSREGGLDAEGLKRLATPPPARSAAKSSGDTERPGERQVRVVGPAFLPDPEAAEDRQARDPAPDR